MAHKKGVGSSKNGRDSIGKRLGIKVFNKQQVNCGQILVRQRGLKWKPGQNVFFSKDYTLHSKIKGIVIFLKKKKKTYINVY
ncbi:MAG: 50S ribosomal protein L27 [Candidatus Shikimatogenerans sp. AspAUS03]|uniref:Large ribosomal subunit protein bL27 n=1 Tax=Candidatus Shikimatogenerans sp. AspAUS03 TaxID=3158563 RepID=A0AAU7QSI7_9FLAO